MFVMSTVMRRRKASFVAALMTGLLVLSAGCGQQAARQTTSTPAQPSSGTSPAPAQTTSSGPKLGGIFKVAHFADAIGLDPHIATALTSEFVFGQVYSTLVQYNDKVGIDPGLAEKWDVAENGTRYTFHLRKGVKWHNGREFVADDVKYSIGRIISLGGPWSARFNVVKEIATPDPYTVVFSLKETFVPFLTTLAEGKAAIVPREEVQKHGDLQKVMVGTGPFKLAEYQPGSRIRLVKNPDYWEQGTPRVDEIQIRIIPDEATRIAALRTGEVDMIPINDPANVDVLKQTPDISIVNVPVLRRHVLVLQTQTPPLNDVRVRQALMLGMDREQILATALSGQGVVSGPFPPGLGEWYIPADKLTFYKRDVQKAKQLLAEAGHAQGFTVQMYASPEYSVHIPIAQVLQQQWKDIGVNVKIDSVEWGVLLDHWRKGTFQILNMPYAGRTDPYYYTYERFHSKNPGNASRFFDAKMDRLTEEGMRTVDLAKRKAIYDELQHYIVEQAPMIYIATGSEIFAMRKSVQGFRGMPTGTLNYYREVWIDKR